MPSDEAMKAARHWMDTTVIGERATELSLADLLDKMMAQARADATQIVVEEITSSTGPTGGWLDSPKAIAAAILERLAGRGK